MSDLSYGANNAWTYWRAASYIDKIFKGANPGDLPIEQPTKFELIINLKTAKALGIAIPNTLLPAARDCRAAGGKLIVSPSLERRASGPRLRLFTRSEVVYWQGRLPRHGRSREIDDQSGAPDMGAGDGWLCASGGRKPS
jgi:hypothetical protein